MKLTRALYFIILFSIPIFCFAQYENHLFKRISFSIQQHYGSFITTMPKATLLKDSYSYFTELNFSLPVIGIQSKNPQYVPDWGLSIFYGNTGSKKYIGNVKGIFPFIDFKLYNRKIFESSIRTGLGIAFVTKPYDINTNHKNVLIGSYANIFINFLWKNQFRITDNFYFNASLSFSHLSNANTKLPNLGLNIPALSAGVTYSVKRLTYLTIPKPDSNSKKPDFYLDGSFGIKQAPWIGSDRYLTAILSSGIKKENYINDKYGIGLAIFYDPSMKHLYLDTIVTLGKTKRPEFNTGPFISYEKKIGKFSIPILLGIYIFDSEAGRIFQNLGLRFQLYNHWSVGSYLLFHWGKADFLHAGIEYTF